MKNQIQTASEEKYSNHTSTLAHETRRSMKSLVMLCIAIVMSLSMGLSSCSQSATAQSGGNVSNVGKIPDGTYSIGDVTITFSGKKVITKNKAHTDLGYDTYGSEQEYTYIIKGDDLIIKKEKDAKIVKFILDGNDLILFTDYYSNYSSASRRNGIIYTKV